MSYNERKLPIGIQSFEKLREEGFLYVDKTEYVYRLIFELKRDKSADEALAQIEDMNYALPYVADKRTLYKVGVNFDSETRMLTEWKVK